MKKIFFCLVFIFLFYFVLAQVSSSTQASFFVEPDATDEGSVESGASDLSSTSLDSFDIIVSVIFILVILVVFYYFVFRKKKRGEKKKDVKRRKKGRKKKK